LRSLISLSITDHAPQIKRDGTANFLCGHHMLLSHAAAYHVYKNKYASEQQGEVGICLDTNFYYPMNENVTQETVDKAIYFKVLEYPS
jgi:beta-glucosidase/6-phospho-beta-glucosidase/beta-galactosidase